MSSDKPVQWRTPDGVMRKIRLRKIQNQTARRSSLSSLSLNNVARPIPTIAKNENQIVKRPNPFAKKRPASESCEALKKRIISSSEYAMNVENIPQPSELSTSEDSRSNEKIYSSEDADSNQGFPASFGAKEQFVYLEEDSIQGIFTNAKSNVNIGSKSLPIDWTIKRKARFLSKSTFNWCGRIKGGEEACAIAQSSRCQHKNIDVKPPFGNASEQLQKSWRVELMRCTTYWQQPCIPWLTMFPRYGQQQKLHNGPHAPIPQSDDVTKAFYENWVISFRSAYQLTREQLCPYFYVCAQQYTALFRAASTTQDNEINCLLTPTTTGLRQSLEKEGIQFTLPLLKNEKIDKNNSENEEDKKNETAAKDDIKQDEKNENDAAELNADEDATWDLISENIQFSTTKELRQNAHTETSTRNIVLVKGNTNIQLLFSYLLNSKSSISNSGLQAHIPPTILSPVAFQGASLKKSSIRSGIARTFSESTLNRGQGDSQHKYSLDITGPLLPHGIMGITELLKKTQYPVGYKAAFSTSMYTAPFNSHDQKGGENNPDKSAKPHDFGLSELTLSKFLNFDTGSVCLNQVTLCNDLYTVND